MVIPVPCDKCNEETGISVVPSKMPETLVLKGKREIGTVTSAERGKKATITSEN